MYQLILLHSCDNLYKISVKINLAPKEKSPQNGTWHWTKSETGVAVKSFLGVQVELMTWRLKWLEPLKEIHWLRVQILPGPTFYSNFEKSFSTICITSSHCTQAITSKPSIKINLATDQNNSQNELLRWTKEEIEVSVQSCPFVTAELIIR